MGKEELEEVMRVVNKVIDKKIHKLKIEYLLILIKFFQMVIWIYLIEVDLLWNQLWLLFMGLFHFLMTFMVL